MGAQASKQQQQNDNKTLLFESTVPVNFSDAVLAQLESSTDSSYTKKQTAEKYIQERISKELNVLETETLEKFENKLNTSLLQSTPEEEELDKNGKLLTSQHLNKKVTELNEHLNNLIQQRSSKFEKNEDLKKIKANLSQCLKDNQGKPLNCYDEIQNFKKIVNDVTAM
ncbi:related to Altered inheritance of mitochondria protein 13, mitochondrial [Saccharomycodes ludwigii]|uniref:Related to Altered inheritance of mitochondria protein 13, mitochondrial n=1 Tax=Saccharomycodes ludwigii TaxID=36035 RepID=A0A376B171_9ASCO|nr:hypothetical protein SCDLUD_003500 [Saccharomycodes ludwigii]KAH3900514.1 hypothetical protein SCDLUD_003500 [Saccharomycodes ludwigii]SSD58403.1 related to Altered inheritance of mitochondria protein 13, mitochondrial [Saccharomycodes ludwigii]